jgi:hypothetical protein
MMRPFEDGEDEGGSLKGNLLVRLDVFRSPDAADDIEESVSEVPEVTVTTSAPFLTSSDVACTTALLLVVDPVRSSGFGETCLTVSGSDGGRCWTSAAAASIVDGEMADVDAGPGAGAGARAAS